VEFKGSGGFQSADGAGAQGHNSNCRQGVVLHFLSFLFFFFFFNVKKIKFNTNEAGDCFCFFIFKAQCMIATAF